MHSNDYDSKLKRMILLQVIFLLLGVLLFIVVKYRGNVYFGDCPFKSAIGIPCPSCGGTRCIINFINMKFATSFRYHPTVFIITVYVILTDIVYIINTILRKNFLSFLYTSMVPLYIFLTLFIVQYLIRIICYINGIENSIMYIYV